MGVDVTGVENRVGAASAVGASPASAEVPSVRRKTLIFDFADIRFDDEICQWVLLSTHASTLQDSRLPKLKTQSNVLTTRKPTPRALRCGGWRCSR